jgi:hypothetical protein
MKYAHYFLVVEFNSIQFNSIHGTLLGKTQKQQTTNNKQQTNNNKQQQTTNSNKQQTANNNSR